MAAFEMSLRFLTLQALLSAVTSQVILNATVWTPEVADISQVSASDKIEVSMPSIVLCASAATSVDSSDLFCYDGITCFIITTQDFNGIRGVTNASYNCYLTGPRCRPPFAEYPGLGCLAFEITDLADFNTSKISCPTGSSLWYPVSNENAEAMRSFLVNDRYGAPSGGVCGPSVPLQDGQPGPCTSSALGDYCCNAGGTCGKATADCNCPTCVNYKAQAKSFYIDAVRVDDQTWEYGDGRSLVGEVDVLPWGPNDPKFTGACVALWMAPGMNTLYHHSDVDCTPPYGRICIWN